MPPPLVEVRVGDVIFAMAPDVAAAVRGGELDPDVGYMQGRIKVTGDHAAFFDLLPLRASLVDAMQRSTD